MYHINVYKDNELVKALTRSFNNVVDADKFLHEIFIPKISESLYNEYGTNIAIVLQGINFPYTLEVKTKQDTTVLQITVLYSVDVNPFASIDTTQTDSYWASSIYDVIDNTYDHYFNRVKVELNKPVFTISTDQTSIDAQKYLDQWRDHINQWNRDPW